MLWPDSNNGTGEGELDFPEMNLASSTSMAFAHHTNSTGPSDQAWFKTPLLPNVWHTAVIEWSPNLVVYQLDGAEIGRTADRTPSTPMHWVTQIETSLDLAGPPDPAAHGNVQYDWASVWAYDATTADVTPPSVAITTPTADSTVGGTINLAATATDTKGVLGVQFKVDGANVGPEQTTAPYTTPWNSTLGTAGVHTITANARDNAGNVGIGTAVVTVDNAVDPVSPTVGTTVPPINGTNFPATANITALFSEAVTGVDASSFTIRNTVTGVSIPATVTNTLNANQSIATLNPTASLTNDTKYTLSLTRAIQDRSGNPSVPAVWSFVTGPVPTAAAKTPAANATNVSRNVVITATASEDLTKVGPASVVVTDPAGTKVSSSTLAFGAATDTITLAPLVALKASTKNTVTLTNAIKDVVGNPLTTTKWTFTTGP